MERLPTGPTTTTDWPPGAQPRLRISRNGSNSDGGPCRRVRMKEKPMTFDELWRLNLDPDGACVDSVDKNEAVGLIAPPAVNPYELLLNAEDCVFLFDV